MKKYKVIFTGGGTGGHVFPLVSIIRNLKDNPDESFELEMHYIGPKDKITEFNFSDEGLSVKSVFTGKLRRRFDPLAILLNILDIIKIPIGVIQSIAQIMIISPDLVFSKGGYGSVPMVLAASMLRVPIILHESDAVPGLANRIISRFATEVFVSFQDTEGINPSKKMVVGNPIRKSILNGSYESAESRFNLQGGKPGLLIMGGSQGSERINNNLLAVLNQLLDDFEIIHQCGKNNFKNIKAETEAFLPESKKGLYHPQAFFNEEELGDAYKVADLIISRAGAGSIFEITAVGKPSILIPLPEAAQDHQKENAYRVAEKGASIVIEEENLTPHFLMERIRSLFFQSEQLEKMKKKTDSFAKPEAGRVISAYIKEYLIS